MEPMIHPVSGVLGWLFLSSLQAGVLVALIITVQLLFGRALSPQWRAALWLLLLARLILPWGPESRASVFNMVPSFVEQSQPVPGPPVNGEPRALTDLPPAKPADIPARELRNAAPSVSAGEVAVGVWSLGFGMVLFSVFWADLQLMRRLRRVRPVTDERVTALLECCKEEMGVHAPLSVVVTDQVGMPSLLGFVHPRILLPKGLLDALGPEQLRFILLHELAHVQRLDIVVGWVAVVLQALHWFNPLVWFAFHRMRADRELACDAAVLSCVGKECAVAYGRTIIALLERASARPRLLPLAGMAETRPQLKRRIAMIAKFKKNRPFLSAVATLILLLLAAVTLTNAVQSPVEAQATAPATPRPGLPDYVPATSTLDSNGRIVDKIDWPFVDDPAVLGAWKSVDFVQEPDQFKPNQMQWRGDLYLKGLTFLPNGRTQQVLRWTKGLLLHDGDRTASVYTIKEFNGEPYMFLEWKTGDYVIRKSKPAYYVLKKDTSVPVPKAEGTAAMSDEQFRAYKKAMVEELVMNVNNINRDTIVAALGEPFQYIWGQSVFTKDTLPDCYIMQYPDRVDFWIRGGQVMEVRFYKPGYLFANGIQVGSTVEEMVKAVGQPNETVTMQKNAFKDGVLYKDIDGQKGHCYYHRSDWGARCFFTDYKVNALYITRSDFK